MRYQFVDESEAHSSQNRFQLVEDESPVKSALRTGYQVASGLAETHPLGYIPEIASTLSAKAQFSSPEEAMSYIRSVKPEELEAERQKRSLGEKQILEKAPTKTNIERALEEKTGLPLTPKSEVDKALKLASTAFGFKTGPLLEKAMAGGSAATIREGLKSSGLNDDQADALSLLLSQFNPIKAAKAIAERQTEKLPSGLTKPSVMESKFPEKAIITKERQEKKLAALDKEAANLAKETLEKRLPISKKMEEGFDFEKQFQDRFSKVRSLAEDFRPEIETSPVEELMKSTSQKYSGIPRPHEDARKILKEVSSFKKGIYNTKDLSNALKIYRSNNQKIKSIYEKSRVLGSQQEYVDWLLDYNKAIGKSIKNSFPEDSAFVKLFETANKDFSEYKNALKAQSILKPIFGENPTPAKLTKLSSDPKTLKKLELALGKKGAEEISVIAKDLKEAKEAIKNIPTEEITKWDALIPLAFLTEIPTEIKDIAALVKGKKFAQFAYGNYLTNPSKRSAYKDAVKALINKDINLYAASAAKLKKSEE